MGKDKKKKKKKDKQKDEGDDYFLYFRRSCMACQLRFTQLADVSRMPRVFLHGNPHVDNFAKTLHGEAMIDFDRSRLGPYAWDMVRLFCSLSLRREEPDESFVPASAVSGFTEGYEAAFRAPESDIPVEPILTDCEPDEDERTTSAYLDANLAWAKRMRKNPLFTTHPTVQGMLMLYARSRNEPDFERTFNVQEAGLAEGTMGKPRIIASLEWKGAPEKDRVLLDIKEVYQDPNTEYFFNPFVHHGLRMIEAGYVHAPGFEQRLGFFTWRDHQYWVRQIPCFKERFRGNFTEDKMRAFAYAVGVQLGRGHRRSLRETHPQVLLDHLRDHRDELLAVGARMNEELALQWNESILKRSAL
jgi:hypothetical protein